MSTNAELARIFDEMAAVLDFIGANSFKVSAHARVARLLADLPEDIGMIARKDPKKLVEMEGIGESSARKIVEFVETGKVRDHEELLAEVPVGLLELRNIPGLGPKTVRILWKEAGVTDLASLKQKLEAGELNDLPRMGAKTLDNLRKSLEFKASTEDRTPIGKALPIAEAMVEALRGMKGVKSIAYAGSLRRGKESIGDIDLIVGARAAAADAVSEAFRTQSRVASILVSGETKSSVRLHDGLQADLRVVDPSSYGAALLYFTGSKEHNIRLREMAQSNGWRLNEYGLFKDDGKMAPQDRGATPIVSATEEEIYAKLGLPWIPPELREDRGECSEALPEDLVTIEDVKAELHAHTNASDGNLSITDLIKAAKDRGFHTIAVTDHSKASAQANGLSVERLIAHIDAIRAAEAKIGGIRVLCGSEVDILADGHLDYDDETLAKLDIVVASPHAALRQEPEAATKRLLAAVTHPLVNILGHPTGRIINGRPGLQPDMHAIIEAAVKHQTALEINAHWMRLDLRDSHVRAAVKAGAMIAINCDVHSIDDFDNLRYGIMTARRGWLGGAQCVNTWPAKKLHDWLAAKRAPASKSTGRRGRQ